MAVTEIAMHDIEVSDDRARTDHGDLEQLAASIKAVGQLQPIVVRPTERGYELVAGERRFRAQELLGAMMIRAEVRDLDDDQALVAEAVENGQRKSFTPSEYGWLGLQLEERAKAGEDMVGKLPSGDRLSERVAKALGVSDRTYRKARDIVAEHQRLEGVPAGDGSAQVAWQVCDRLVQQMDEAGKVDGVHRQFLAFRRLLELSAHDDATVAEMAAATLSRSIEERGLDLTLEVEGIESFAAQIPAGTDVADPAAADEHDVALGGSDASPPEASEPAPAWKDLSGAQREAMAHLWREGDLRYSNATTESTIYHLVADHLEALGLVSITVPPGGTLDDRVVELTDLGADVMCRFAEEWWPAQRAALSGLASDWQLVEDYAPPSPWEEAGVVFERNGGAKFRALTIIGSTTALSQVLDTLDEAEDFLEASGFTTPTRAGGDDDADGKGSAGPSELATEHDASAAPAADDAGESASEPPATQAGARPEGWPPRAEGHPSLGEMVEAGFRSAAGFYCAARQLMDSILDGDTPEEAVERLQAGPGCLSDEQLDYVLAHFDVPAPAPDLGSEPPAPIGVNEVSAVLSLEGDELAPDPSAEVPTSTTEGEVSDGAVPAPLPSEDGEPEIRRSGSPSTTYRRPAEKKRPVRLAEFGRLRVVLAEAAAVAGHLEPADVEPVLANIADVDQFIADVQGAIDVLTPFLADLRLLARPPG